MEQGGGTDKTPCDGWTLLHLAANHGHLETSKLLMVYGADLNARNSDGRLPINVAATERSDRLSATSLNAAGTNNPARDASSKTNTTHCRKKVRRKSRTRSNQQREKQRKAK